MAITITVLDEYRLRVHLNCMLTTDCLTVTGFRLMKWIVNLVVSVERFLVFFSLWVFLPSL